MTRRKFITDSGATAVGAGTGTRGRGTSTNRQAQRRKRQITTTGAPKPAGPYSQAIVVGNTIYVAGQGPFDPQTGKMPPGFEEQAARTFENIRAIVEAAGATLSDVVKVNVFLADLANFQKMNEVYKRYFREPYPVRATVGTQLLGGMGIEIECVAVRR